MKILYTASEGLPFIASGGLADVAGSLPQALVQNDAECTVILPLYGTIKQELREILTFLTNFTVPLSWRNQYCGVFTTKLNGATYYLLDNEYYFNRSDIYGYDDDIERFAFFSRAILELLKHIDYKPDIISCNDWQTALVPVYLKLFYQNYQSGYENIKTVFTIHNIAYQGKCGLDKLGDIFGISNYSAGMIEYGGCVNLMKGALETCDKITTVSPTYAKEIMNPYFSHGLDGILKGLEFKLCGIINGIDTNLYNPETDKLIANNYTKENYQDKVGNKKALMGELGLVYDEKPVIGIVTRLVAHKGLDLVKYVFEDIIRLGFKVVILGSGDYVYEEFFARMRDKYPAEVAFVLGFIPVLARKIYAGADLFLMPSQSEPCGLAQMIAVRYGTIPIVRKTGGLNDSIIDCDQKGGNGFTFYAYNAHDMLCSIERGKKAFENTEVWDNIVKTALDYDFSWNTSAKQYLVLYESMMG